MGCFMRSDYYRQTALTILSILAVSTSPLHAGDSAGAAIYLQKCARCHGKAGEGAKPHPHPLVGNRSLAQLTKYTARWMPEDAPGSLSAADAEKVSSYIFDAFYSPAAQARI